jgi:hypothetical protein
MVQSCKLNRYGSSSPSYRSIVFHMTTSQSSLLRDSFSPFNTPDHGKELGCTDSNRACSAPEKPPLQFRPVRPCCLGIMVPFPRLHHRLAVARPVHPPTSRRRTKMSTGRTAGSKLANGRARGSGRVFSVCRVPQQIHRAIVARCPDSHSIV